MRKLYLFTLFFIVFISLSFGATLEISKSANKSEYLPGETATFIVTYKAATFTSAAIEINWDANFSMLSVTPTPNYGYLFHFFFTAINDNLPHNIIYYGIIGNELGHNYTYDKASISNGSLMVTAQKTVLISTLTFTPTFTITPTPSITNTIFPTNTPTLSPAVYLSLMSEKTPIGTLVYAPTPLVVPYKTPVSWMMGVKNIGPQPTITADIAAFTWNSASTAPGFVGNCNIVVGAGSGTISSYTITSHAVRSTAEAINADSEIWLYQSTPVAFLTPGLVGYNLGIEYPIGNLRFVPYAINIRVGTPLPTFTATPTATRTSTRTPTPTVTVIIEYRTSLSTLIEKNFVMDSPAGITRVAITDRLPWFKDKNGYSSFVSRDRVIPNSYLAVIQEDEYVEIKVLDRTTQLSIDCSSNTFTIHLHIYKKP